MVVIILVIWKIKRTMEAEFLLWWSKPKPVTKGLFREFLSKVTDDELNTWDIESFDCITYVNVGIWESEDAFKSQIKIGKTEDFEAKRRRRVILKMEYDREGDLKLPPSIVKNLN